MYSIPRLGWIISAPCSKLIHLTIQGTKLNFWLEITLRFLQRSALVLRDNLTARYSRIPGIELHLPWISRQRLATTSPSTSTARWSVRNLCLAGKTAVTHLGQRHSSSRAVQIQATRPVLVGLTAYSSSMARFRLARSLRWEDHQPEGFRLETHYKSRALLRTLPCWA